jgi:hypothetical protein
VSRDYDIDLEMSRSYQSYDQAAMMEHPCDEKEEVSVKAPRDRFFWIILSALAFAEFARANDAVILPIIVSVSLRSFYVCD